MCDCINMVNAELDKRNAKLAQSLIVRNGEIALSNTIIATETANQKKRKSMPLLFASYCPFCGEKYLEVASR